MSFLGSKKYKQLIIDYYVELELVTSFYSMSYKIKLEQLKKDMLFRWSEACVRIMVPMTRILTQGVRIASQRTTQRDFSKATTRIPSCNQPWEESQKRPLHYNDPSRRTKDPSCMTKILVIRD